MCPCRENNFVDRNRVPLLCKEMYVALDIHFVENAHVAA